VDPVKNCGQQIKEGGLGVVAGLFGITSQGFKHGIGAWQTLWVRFCPLCSRLEDVCKKSV